MKSFAILSLAAIAGGLALPALAYDPIITMPGEQQTVTPADQNIHIFAGADTTDGKIGFLVLEDVVAGGGPGPAITHSKESETWYVLEGTYEFHVGDTVFEGGPGTFVSVDAGQPHGFINKTAGKLLVVFAPGGYEEFFKEWDEKGLARGPDLGKLEQTYGVTRPAPAP
jgi:mannose-6-phosphate isomerase-like protein (cupin superfamily)